MATMDLGRVTPIYRGDYSATTSYELNDIVTYTDGCVYWHYADAETTGTDCTDDTVWALVIDSSGIPAMVAAAQTAQEAAEIAQAAAEKAQTGAETAATTAAEQAEAATESATAAADSATNAAESAESVAASAAAIAVLEELGLSVVDGEINVTYEEE